ncbi:MAG TPA: DUF2062 domain-containing protein [Casimicrobiaceae bacterium]|nr:DUF2062 domain-containing protein [Casimicrobiaceae bacterium]
MLRQALRRWIERLKPSVEKITRHPWVVKYIPALSDPDLWHLNRRSTARGVAVGLLCGLIPGPVQVAGAIGLSLLWRANFPLAALTTLYTNPLTIVPLYVLAYEYGRLFFPGAPHAVAALPPSYHGLSDYVPALAAWMAELGKPLALGIMLLALTLSAVGFLTVRLAWRWHVVAAWRRRARRRGRRA